MSSDRGLHWRYPGARWWKFDFHTHTPASRDYGKGPGQDSLKSITPREWLLGFMRAGVDCVAITDHNSGEWVDRLKDAYQELKQESSPDFRPLYLFPGVEITANGGIHVLAVLDADKGATDVAALLGAVGYQGVRGESDSVAKLATIGVVEGISEAGGIPILAHVDGPSGAWRLTGNTLAPLFDFDGLFAIEVVDPGKTKPELYRQRQLAWAEVLGSDSHHPHGQAGSRFPGSHYTWVKMSEPSLEGLRLALLDGRGFSIRRSDESDDPEPFDPFALPEHCIEAIEIADARYMGRGKPARLEFNPWLNALVGGRGTGKSTVIHAMRLAAGRGHELKHLEEHSEPLLTFRRFERVPRDRTDKGGLTKSTNIAWTMMRGGVRHRLHWRQDGSRTTVEEDAGEAGGRPSPAQTVTPEHFPVRMFSQGQIAALAGENRRALLQVIDEAAGVAALQRDLEEARNAFYVAKAHIRDLEGRLARRNDLTVEQQDVGRKLKRFEEAGHTAILTAYRRHNRQRTEAGRQFDAAEAASDRIEQAAAALQPEDLPDGLFNQTSEEDRQAVAIMAALATAVRTAAQDLRHIAERLRGLVATQRKELAGSAWQAAVEHAANEYEALIETLRKEGVGDPSEYGRLVQERQRLDSELARLDSVQEERDRLIERSRSLLDNVAEARRAVSRGRDRFLKETLEHNEFVRIRSLHYGDDPRAIERSLRETLEAPAHFEGDILVMEDGHAVNGCIAELLDKLPEDAAQRSREMEDRIGRIKHRIHAAGAGKGDFGGHFNNHLEAKYKKSPEVFDKVQTWFPEDGLLVEYSRRGDGTDFHPIFQASAGQRAAAMLAFLLAHGEEPLVLDQPEDDLDNLLIYDLVVRQIRENKLRRQIILVTHNPNIVVNGDAEMLHALDFRGGQCIVVRSGSLQEKAMREEICRIMEGGREAFERRYRRLGKEPPHV